MFLYDGTPVTSEEQLQKDDEIYVSTGEVFKDPYLSLQGRIVVFQDGGGDNTIVHNVYTYYC